jgi:hypothetical protein
MTLSVATLCHYAECRCVECHDLLIAVLNVNMLDVVVLSVVAPFLLQLDSDDLFNNILPICRVTVVQIDTIFMMFCISFNNN